MCNAQKWILIIDVLRRIQGRSEQGLVVQSVMQRQSVFVVNHFNDLSYISQKKKKKLFASRETNKKKCCSAVGSAVTVSDNSYVQKQNVYSAGKHGL